MLRGVRRLLVRSAALSATLTCVAALCPGAASASVAPSVVARSAAVAPSASAAPSDQDDPLSAFATLRPSRAVTHGLAVTSPASSVPWAVSIWLEDPATDARTGSGKMRFICSATAISPVELVTAAHCTKAPGYLYVRVGANSLTGGAGAFIPVESLRAHSGYRTNGGVDDIAVLRPLFPLGLRSYARLATPAIATAARAGKRALTIYGWGDTEADKLTGQLRTTKVQQQQVAAGRVFGGLFVPTRMIAAGHLDAATKRFAGGCHGDSGGPLTTKVGATTYLVGVTDFGLSKGCDLAPTVFASVGDYAAWELQSRSALVTLARTHNLALPVALSAPTVTGTVALGQTLSCVSGRWSANSGKVVSGWFRGDTSLGVGAEHVVTSLDAAQQLHCVSAAVSAAGYSGAEAAGTVSVPGLPAAVGAPGISGLVDGQEPVVGGVLTCGGVTATSADATTTYEWLHAAAPDGVGATVLAAGPALTLDQATIDALRGRYLVCRATTANAMGSVASLAYVSVPLPAAPTPAPQPAPSAA